MAAPGGGFDAHVKGLRPRASATLTNSGNSPTNRETFAASQRLAASNMVVLLTTIPRNRSAASGRRLRLQLAVPESSEKISLLPNGSVIDMSRPHGCCSIPGRAYL
jgi:hypothetical protein